MCLELNLSKAFIPTDLEEDWYLNEAISNLIVVDDQMAETASDNGFLIYLQKALIIETSVSFFCSRIFFTREKSVEQ